MYCKKCGRELSENAKFCAGCGGKVEVERVSKVKNNKISKLKFKILTGVIGVVLIGIIGCVLLAGTEKVTVVGEYQNGLIMLQCGDKCGLMDYNGNIVEPCIYDEIIGLDGIPQGKIEDEWVQLQVAEIIEVEEYVFSSIGLLKSGNGERIRQIGNDRYIVSLEDGYVVNIIDAERNIIKNFSEKEFFLSDIMYINAETCIVKIMAGDGRYGLLDSNGRIIVDTEYTWISSFSEGIAIALKYDEYNGEQCGCISTEGEIIIPFKYEYIGRCSQKMIPAGNMVVEWKEYYSESGNYYEYTPIEEWSYGYLNRDGGTAIVFAYDYCSDFIDGLAVVGVKNDSGKMQYGYIDINDNLVIPMQFDNACGFVNGRALVAKEGMDGYWKYGFINKNGEVVIPFEYEGAQSFSEGLAAVAKRDEEGEVKWGYINENGEVVIPFEYNSASAFSDNVALVEKRYMGSSVYGYINTEGVNVIPFEYDYGYSFENGIALVEKRDIEGNWKTGCINKNDKELVPTIYDYIDKSGMGLTLINSSGSMCCIKPLANIDDTIIDIGELRLAEINSDGIYKAILNSKEELIVEIDKDFMKCANYYKKAVNYYEKGRTEKAIKTLEKAILLQPDNVYLKELKVEWE